MRLITLLFLLPLLLRAQTEVSIHPTQVGLFGAATGSFLRAGASGGQWESAASLQGTLLLPAGTTNQTMRYTGSAWVGSSTLSNDGNFVGIGTLNPALLLDIRRPGNDAFISLTGYDAKIKVGGTPSGGSTTLSAQFVLESENSAIREVITEIVPSLRSTALYRFYGAEVTNTFSGVDGVVRTQSGSPFYQRMWADGGQFDFGIINRTNGQVFGSADLLPRFTIRNTGNIGINQENPAQKLDVNGTARIVTATGTPTNITGRNAAGDIGNVSIGTGIAFSGGVLSSSGVVTASNGLNVSSGDVKKGGNLTQNTTTSGVGLYNETYTNLSGDGFQVLNSSFLASRGGGSLGIKLLGEITADPTLTGLAGTDQSFWGTSAGGVTTMYNGYGASIFGPRKNNSIFLTIDRTLPEVWVALGVTTFFGRVDAEANIFVKNTGNITNLSNFGNPVYIEKLTVQGNGVFSNGGDMHIFVAGSITATPPNVLAYGGAMIATSGGGPSTNWYRNYGNFIIASRGNPIYMGVDRALPKLSVESTGVCIGCGLNSPTDTLEVDGTVKLTNLTVRTSETDMLYRAASGRIAYGPPVDASATNEIQSYGHSGTTSYTNTLSLSGGSFTLNTGSGIGISHSGGTVTISNTGDTNANNDVNTVQDDGVTMTQRQTLNFVSTATINQALTDNAGLGTTEIRANIPTGAVGATELASSGVTAATYGSSTLVPVFTIDQDGRVTSATTAAVTATNIYNTSDALTSNRTMTMADYSLTFSKTTASSTPTTALIVNGANEASFSNRFFEYQDNGTMRFRMTGNSALVSMVSSTRPVELQGSTYSRISASAAYIQAESGGGIAINNVSSDPSSPANGTFWYNSTSHLYKDRVNSATRTRAYVETDFTGNAVSIRTANHTPSGLDYSLIYDANAGGFTVTLGSGLKDGYDYRIKCRRNGTNTITFSAEAGYVFEIDQISTIAPTSIVMGGGGTGVQAPHKVYTVRRAGTNIFIQ